MKNGEPVSPARQPALEGVPLADRKVGSFPTGVRATFEMEEMLEELEGKLAVLYPLIRTTLLKQNKRRGQGENVHVSSTCLSNTVSPSLPGEHFLETGLS